MDSFRTCQAVEVQGLQDIVSFLKMNVHEGRFVLTDKGALSGFLQKTVGDILINRRDGHIFGVELKSEQSNRYGNFFLETWSNKAFGLQNVGWMYTLRTDLLLYYFIEQRELYCMWFRDPPGGKRYGLWSWAFVKNGNSGRSCRLFDFPEKPQGKYEQLNQTWGCCVPISVIEKEVGFRKYVLGGNVDVA